MSPTDPIDHLYGDLETRERARVWAAAHGYRLSDSNACIHVLMSGRCGRSNRWREEDHVFRPDHGRLWRTRLGDRFILAHLYTTPERLEATAGEWAAEYGLGWDSRPDDAWYGHGTLPVRYWRHRTGIDPARYRQLSFERWLRRVRREPGRSDAAGDFARSLPCRAVLPDLGNMLRWEPIRALLEVFEADTAQLVAGEAAWHEWRHEVGIELGRPGQVGVLARDHVEHPADALRAAEGAS